VSINPHLKNKTVVFHSSSSLPTLRG